MSVEDAARERGGCGEVINADAWCDPDAVPSTAGLCDSAEKHREHGESVVGYKGLRTWADDNWEDDPA